MATSKINIKSPTIRRIMREAQELASAPSPDFVASPLETDLFEWHFTLRGPPNSPYASGLYHGRILLPPTYPLKPPNFRFSTPSGRFEANREICLSISGHHEETWQPAWGVRTALVALRAFMETDPKGQLGGLDVPDATRRALAEESMRWRCPACSGGRTNGEIMEECSERARLEEERGENGDGSSSNSSGSKNVDVVPEQLKKAYLDKLGKGVENEEVVGTKKTEKDVEEDTEAARLVEGFVQTMPREALPAEEPVASVCSAVVDAPASDAAQSKVRRRPTPTPTLLPPASQQRQHLRQREVVPAWIDQLIVLVAVLLGIMVLRVLVG